MGFACMVGLEIDVITLYIESPNPVPALVKHEFFLRVIFIILMYNVSLMIDRGWIVTWLPPHDYSTNRIMDVSVAGSKNTRSQ